MANQPDPESCMLHREVQGEALTVETDGPAIEPLGGFRLEVCRLWGQALKRRNQRNKLQWSRYGRLADLYIPRPRNHILTQRIVSRHLPEAGAVCSCSARTDLCGGSR